MTRSRTAPSQVAGARQRSWLRDAGVAVVPVLLDGRAAPLPSAEVLRSAGLDHLRDTDADRCRPS